MSHGHSFLVQENDSSDSNTARKVHLRVGGNGEEKNLFNRFARDSWRQSLSNQPNMFKWLDAQERQEDKFNQVGLPLMSA